MSQSYVFIAAAGEDKVLTGKLNSETGHIDLVSECVVPGGPEMLALDPRKRFLFAGCHPRHYGPGVPKGDSRIHSLKIDWETGRLELFHTISLATPPVHMSIDKKGKFLLTASYQKGNAVVHPINENGEVGEPTQTFLSGGGAHSIMADPSGKFVFLPHITVSHRNKEHWPPLISEDHILPSASNTILQFRFDDEAGTLTPNTPFMVAGERGGGPRHFCFHPERNMVYFTAEQGCAVIAYSLDPEKGTLAPVQFISTLPAEGCDDFNTCASLRITSSGRFLYVLNRGYDSIACFETDPVSGRLSLKQLLMIDAKPREMEISLDDRFLFTADYESRQVTSYRIAEDGTLTVLESLNVGKKPMWIVNAAP